MMAKLEVVCVVRDIAAGLALAVCVFYLVLWVTGLM